MPDAFLSQRANLIPARFRTALTEMYGDRLERVVLFSSRARGDAQPDSDYDVAIFEGPERLLRSLGGTP
jgi:predicted nucleotidyltransferase